MRSDERWGFLLHGVKILPTNVPCSIVWETRIGLVGTIIPTCTHHGNGSEEGSVARKVKAQSVGGLVVVTLDEIAVLGMVGQKEVDGGRRLA